MFAFANERSVWCPFTDCLNVATGNRKSQSAPFSKERQTSARDWCVFAASLTPATSSVTLLEPPNCYTVQVTAAPESLRAANAHPWPREPTTELLCSCEGTAPRHKGTVLSGCEGTVKAITPSSDTYIPQNCPENANRAEKRKIICRVHDWRRTRLNPMQSHLTKDEMSQHRYRVLLPFSKHVCPKDTNCTPKVTSREPHGKPSESQSFAQIRC